jgi:hypothetical protein
VEQLLDNETGYKYMHTGNYNKLNSPIPEFLQTQPNITIIDLSTNQFVCCNMPSTSIAQLTYVHTTDMSAADLVSIKCMCAMLYVCQPRLYCIARTDTTSHVTHQRAEATEVCCAFS